MERDIGKSKGIIMIVELPLKYVIVNDRSCERDGAEPPRRY